MFEVKGERAQWRVLYDRLAAMDVGDVIKDDELAGLLPDAAEGSIRSAFYRAQRETEDRHKRTFARVRTVGYRMVEAIEHEDLARGHHKRARRQLRSAWRKAHSADRAKLSQQERQRLDQIEMNLAQQREMTSKLETKVHAEIRERKAGEAQLSDRVDQLTKLVKRLTDSEQPV